MHPLHYVKDELFEFVRIELLENRFQLFFVPLKAIEHL